MDKLNPASLNRSFQFAILLPNAFAGRMHGACALEAPAHLHGTSRAPAEHRMHAADIKQCGICVPQKERQELPNVLVTREAKKKLKLTYRTQLTCEKQTEDKSLAQSGWSAHFTANPAMLRSCWGAKKKEEKTTPRSLRLSPDRAETAPVRPHSPWDFINR